MMFLNFLTGSIFPWLPEIFTILGFLLVFLLYRKRRNWVQVKKYSYSLIASIVLVRIIYAGLLIFLQYYVWKQDDFSKLLLPPHQSLEYFTSYSWIHFGLPLVLSLGSSLLFFCLLIGIKKYRTTIFDNGEIELGFSLALILGWPIILLFVPSIFILLLMISVIGIILSRKWKYKAPVAPALWIAALLTSLWSFL